MNKIKGGVMEKNYRIIVVVVLVIAFGVGIALGTVITQSAADKKFDQLAEVDKKLINQGVTLVDHSNAINTCVAVACYEEQTRQLKELTVDIKKNQAKRAELLK